ncbi:MAG: cupredoxin domain-containing protein [Dehalococcoidia bacterium]
MRSLWPALFAILALAVPVLSACGGESGASALATATPVRTIEVDLQDIAYTSSRLELAAGEVVDLVLTNSGALDHDFTIDEMPGQALVLGPQTASHQEHATHAAVHAAPGPGKTVTARLRPSSKGQFAFYCSVKGHRDAGMAGTLLVT